MGLLTALGGPAPNIGEEIPPSHAEALEIVSNDCTSKTMHSVGRLDENEVKVRTYTLLHSETTD